MKNDEQSELERLDPESEVASKPLLLGLQKSSLRASLSEMTRRRPVDVNSCQS
jgi:hypothetical protein